VQVGPASGVMQPVAAQQPQGLAPQASSAPGTSARPGPSYQVGEAVQVRPKDAGPNAWSRGTVTGQGQRPGTYNVRFRSVSAPSGSAVVPNIPTAFIRKDQADNAQSVATTTMRPPNMQTASPTTLQASQLRLPPDWQTAWSEADHANYYWNRITGETTWDPPHA